MVLPCLMGVFNSIWGSCFGWIGERISEEAGHLISYGDNLENLRTQIQDLTDTIKSIEDRIKEAESSQGATLVDAVVDRLLKRMTTLKAEASKIIVDEERSSDCTCIVRLRPNLWACYLISKSAKKAIGEAAELLEKEKKFDRAVAAVDYSNCLGVTPNPDFEELESRVLASKQIMEALKDPKVQKVGVYGMGGTGKTTLAVKIGADLQLNGTFRYVVLATVSEKQSLLQNNYQSDLISIQKQIAGGLKIQLQGETVNDRATQLRKQLQKMDKLLIILDDIWSKFEFETVGIPIGTNNFKILMTSRNKLVLENDMDSTNNFRLNSLPIDDARNLFDKMIGGDAHYSNWPLIAYEVVDLCGGIPILLVTIGRALRNATQSIWEDALTQLKRFDGEDIDEEGYKKVEVSYNFLKNEELKKLFLLCAQLNHRSIPMDDLLKYAIGLNLFKGRKKVKEVSSRLHKYLHDLKGCCLLQDSNEGGVIKMHDVVHKFAAFVAARDHGVLSVANDGEMEEWPSKDELEDFSAISLPYCRLPPDHMLPAAFDNPKLESFLLLRSQIDASFQISDNFFAGMKGLKLMNLTRMSMSSIPVSSLSALVKLRTLCLDHCELSDISVIGELPMLQALSLVGSSIVLIPKEIGKLGNTLKLLDLLDCSELKTIAAGVISRLTLLEDLRIAESCQHWEHLEGNHKRSNIVDETDEAGMVSMEEFKNLENLINLEIHVHEPPKMFPKDLVFKKLETFKIFFGNYEEWLRSEYISTRKLEVYASTTVEFDGEGYKALLTSAESLLLARVNMGSVTVSEMDQKGFPELKHLKVQVGMGIQYIVKKNYSNCTFPKLETLDLISLYRLERICDDYMLQGGSFENLRVINVRSCTLLNDLFSSNLAKDLLRLQEMRVEDCGSMETIVVSIESENEAAIRIGFTHQLRVLQLSGLPRLRSFYRFKQIEGVPCPIPLFNEKIMFPKLEELKLSGMKNEKIWEFNHLTEGTCWFQNLTSLEVSHCDNLGYLFTFSMVKSFSKLKRLQVSHCESIEEIILTRKGEIEREKLSLFPKLEYLTLISLPKLKRFCHADLLEFQSLQELNIVFCLQLNSFVGANESTHDLGENSTPLFDEKVVFPELKRLTLLFVGVEKIWDVDHLAIAWFQNLTYLEVIDCHNLRHVFTSSMVKSFAKLLLLRVSTCESIEEIVASIDVGDIQLSLLKLETLELNCLPKFKRFCQANLLEFPLLKNLVIQDCLELQTFIMSASNDYSSPDKSAALFNEKIAFPNLVALDIHECHSVKKVFDFQVFPRLLLPFAEMTIGKCDSLEEIVGIDDQQEEGYMVFERLEVIHLKNLKSLTGFCSTCDCNFLFPSLNRVIVKNCLKLKFFSNGALITPKLISVDHEKKEENEERWEGDLNSTIRRLFEEKEDEDEDGIYSYLDRDEVEEINNMEEFDCLPADEARNLFDKWVGGDSQYSNWPLTAQQVIDRCRGISVLLALTGASLRNEDESIWEETLTHLKQFDGQDIYDYSLLLLPY